MAKVKTKKAAMDTTCTETANGGWTWLVGGRDWYWRQWTGPGLNFGPLSPPPERKWTPALFVRTLNEAVMYSWGYDQGFENGSKKKE